MEDAEHHHAFGGLTMLAGFRESSPRITSEGRHSGGSHDAMMEGCLFLLFLHGGRGKCGCAIIVCWVWVQGLHLPQRQGGCREEEQDNIPGATIGCLPVREGGE